MKACAGAEKIDIEILKAAKSAGCPGFDKSSRVYWAKVKPWLAEHKEELQAGQKNTKAYWEIERLTWAAKREQQKFETEAKLNWPKDQVLKHCKTIGEKQKTLLLSKCRNELGPKLTGLNVQETIDLLEKFACDVCAVFSGGLARMEHELNKK